MSAAFSSCSSLTGCPASSTSLSWPIIYTGELSRENVQLFSQIKELRLKRSSVYKIRLLKFVFSRHLALLFLILFLSKYFPLSVFSRYSGRPVLTQSGLYDPTTILETERIATCQRESWAKLVIYTVIFFYSLAG